MLLDTHFFRGNDEVAIRKWRPEKQTYAGTRSKRITCSKKARPFSSRQHRFWVNEVSGDGTTKIHSRTPRPSVAEKPQVHFASHVCRLTDFSTSAPQCQLTQLSIVKARIDGLTPLANWLFLSMALERKKTPPRQSMHLKISTTRTLSH